MRLALLAVSLTLAACGPPVDLSGTYSGSAAFVTSCGSGQVDSRNLDITWTVTDRGDSASINPGGTCGSFEAFGSSGSLVLREKACPDTVDSNGNAIHTSLHSGDVSERPEGIAVSAELYESGVIFCTSTINGVLTKQ